MTRGILVALEGGDGAGKSTVRRRLYKLLSAQGIACISTIPRSYMDSGATRVFTLHKYGRRPYAPEDIVRAYVADREALARWIVAPALEQGLVVLLDRYLWSDIVYLTHVHHLDHEVVTRGFRFARIVHPDLTVFVRNDPALAMDRIQARGLEVHDWERVESQRMVVRAMDALSDVLEPRSLLRISNEGTEADLEPQVALAAHKIVALMAAGE